MLSKERGKYFQEKWDEMEYKFANMEMKQQITQLTNNWNELEEWLKEGTEELPYINGDMYWREACENVLDKMKKIKEKNNEK